MGARLLTSAKSGINGLLNLIYPPACVICGRKLTDSFHQGLYACGDCLLKIRKNPPPYCKGCGRSLAGCAETVEICAECSSKNFHYDRTWSCFLYEGVIKDALHLFKYSGRLALSNLFSRLIVGFLKDNSYVIENIDAVIAVPLHGARLREREFNQSGVLTSAVVKEFGIRDASGHLRRTLATKPQSQLDKKERSENIRGAFKVSSPEGIRGNRLLLIDDVFTTGATLDECSRVLKAAGAVGINCLTIARGAN